MKINEERVNYIRNAVDLTTGNTGYPVLGRYLEEAGVASREEVRHLAKKGLLQTIEVRHNNSKNGSRGTLYKAYYTERHIPAWVTKQEGLSTSEA